MYDFYFKWTGLSSACIIGLPKKMDRLQQLNQRPLGDKLDEGDAPK
jgi:hypothetical protein